MASKRSGSFCEPCNASFEYPSRYRQHVASRSHKLFVESLGANGLQNDRPKEAEEVEDTGHDSGSGVGVHDECFALFNEEEDRDSDQSELDELIEELDEKSSGSFYPFPSKIFALLFMLVNSPHPMGEKNLLFVWFILKQIGIQAPSLSSVRSFRLPGIQLPQRHVNNEGLPFFSIPLANFVRQCLGRLDLAKSLVRFPVRVEGTFTEMYHGNRWHTDPRFFSPMVKLLDGTSVFIRDCVSFNSSGLGITKGVIQTFFHKESMVDVFAEVDILLDLKQFQHMVPDTTATHLDSDTLIVYGKGILSINDILGIADHPYNIIRWNSPGFIRVNSEDTAAYFAPHPLKAKAAGKHIVMVPLILFSDDTSGNRSKKWHKFESWYLKFAGLPRHISSRLENIHFLSCSDTVSPLDLCKPIASQLTTLETDGVVVYDMLYKEEVLAVAPLICIVCDNPRASELLNHLGSCALRHCRLCMTERILNSDMVCEMRTRDAALLQMTEISAQQTEQAKVEKRKEFGLKEDENPLLHIPADLYRSIPVEVLHTILLGPAKYLLKELMSQMSATVKEEILARVRAFNTSGFKVKLYGNVCRYYQSFVGRDFKAWTQMAIFIMGPYLSDGQKRVLLCFSKACACKEVFQITYCDYFSASLSDEWQMRCQDFVDAVKEHMPIMLQKQKTHLILHLVECMKEFGPASAFSAERFESFNSNVRTFNVYGNKRAPSRDIAYRFSILQQLRYICHDGSFHGDQRCGAALREMFSSKLMRHTMCSVPMEELQDRKRIYQPGAARKALKSLYTVSSLPLVLGDMCCTTLEQIERDCLPYEVALSGFTTADQVEGFRAIISQESSLVNVGEYIQLANPHLQIKYGILIGVLKTSNGAVFCLVQGFDSLFQSANGQIIMNDCDCPLLELNTAIFSTSCDNIQQPVSIVHECTNSCCIQEGSSVRTVEREDIECQKMVFQHDWTNRLYCYNVYCY